MPNKTLCITQCGSAKIWAKRPDAGPTAAGDAYTGTFGRSCRAYAEHFFGEEYVILSAKHGFLRPNDILPGDYDVSFRHKNNPEQITLDQLRQQICDKGLDTYHDIVILGSKRYGDIIEAAFGEGHSYHHPLRGCKGIGYMVQKVQQALRNGDKLW